MNRHWEVEKARDSRGLGKAREGLELLRCIVLDDGGCEWRSGGGRSCTSCVLLRVRDNWVDSNRLYSAHSSLEPVLVLVIVRLEITAATLFFHKIISYIQCPLHDHP